MLFDYKDSLASQQQMTPSSNIYNPTNLQFILIATTEDDCNRRSFQSVAQCYVVGHNN